MRTIVQIGKENRNVNFMTSLPKNCDVFSICFPSAEHDDAYFIKNIKDIPLRELEKRIDRPENYSFIYVYDDGLEETDEQRRSNE